MVWAALCSFFPFFFLLRPKVVSSFCLNQYIFLPSCSKPQTPGYKALHTLVVVQVLSEIDC